jgi:uncharacterized protein YutE (UPF0331/DUF86 family)
VSIEAMIDIADRVASLENRPAPSDSYSAMQGLEALGVIVRAERYRNMIRFRNFVVHRYESVEVENLAAILSRSLDDFDAFVKEVTDHG